MKTTKEIKIIALALLLSTGLAACGKQQSPTVEAISNNAAVSDTSSVNSFEYHASKIIGINPLVPVRADGSNMDSSLRGYLDAFGIVALGDSGSCTGTHLGNGFVLTAGHCFLEGASTSILSNQACPTTKVYWGYRGSPATGSPKPVVNSVSQCVKVIYAELTEARDFAIFQVNNPPKAAVAVAMESARTAPNTKLTIFGYPQGRPLEWSQYCPLKKNTVAPTAITSPARFAHQCDTEPGNSGSSILAIGPNGVAKVVGVHDAAAPDPLKYNIGTYMFDARQILLKQGFNLDQATGAIAARNSTRAATRLH